MYSASRIWFVLFVSTRRMNGGVSTPSIVIRSWFSASCPVPPIIPPGNAWFMIPPTRCAQRG